MTIKARGKKKKKKIDKLAFAKLETFLCQRILTRKQKQPTEWGKHFVASMYLIRV